MTATHDSPKHEIPVAVVNAAIELVKDSDARLIRENVGMLIRLVGDGRMIAVWKELFRTNSDRVYFHPANSEAFDPNTLEIEFLERQMQVVRSTNDAEYIQELTRLEMRVDECRRSSHTIAAIVKGMSVVDRQEWACSLFFKFAFITAALNSVVTLEEIDRAAEHHRAIGSGLEQIAVTARAALDGDFSTKFDVEPVIAALRRKEITLRSEKFGKLVVRRHRANPKLRAFAKQMEGHTRNLFRTSLYGTLATLANVAFNQENITGVQIRDLVRS